MGGNISEQAHEIGAHFGGVLQNPYMPPRRHHVPPTYPEFVQRIGENIRAAREARQITAEKLATKSGLVVSTITHLEAGSVKSPRLQTLLRIANALDAPPALLFDMGDERRYTDEVRQAAATLLRVVERESKE